MIAIPLWLLLEYEALKPVVLNLKLEFIGNGIMQTLFFIQNKNHTVENKATLLF